MKNEDEINKFIDELFSEKAPNYSNINKEKELVEIAEISLFLKKSVLKNNSFKAKLLNRLTKEFGSQRSGSEYPKRTRKVLFNILSLGVSFSILVLLFNPFLVYVHKKNININNKAIEPVKVNKKQFDIVKISTRRFSEGKTLTLLYNERNNVILYWPFGQVAIFQ